MAVQTLQPRIPCRRQLAVAVGTVSRSELGVTNMLLLAFQ